MCRLLRLRCAAHWQAVTTAVAFQFGLGSALFAVALCFSLVVMYDAAGVRRHAGTADCLTVSRGKPRFLQTARGSQSRHMVCHTMHIVACIACVSQIPNSAQTMCCFHLCMWHHILTGDWPRTR